MNCSKVGERSEPKNFLQIRCEIGQILYYQNALVAEIGQNRLVVAAWLKFSLVAENSHQWLTAATLGFGIRLMFCLQW